MWDWDSVDGLADEAHILSIDILNNHNSLLGEEMEGKVVDSISKDRLLNEQNIAAGGNNLLDEVDNIFLLLLQDPVHGSVVIDNNVVLQISLWCGHAELDHTNLGIIHSGWASSEVRHLVLGETKSINELRVIDGSSEFHGNLDVVEVDIGVFLLINNLEHGVDSHWGEHVGVGRHDL